MRPNTNITDTNDTTILNLMLQTMLLLMLHVPLIKVVTTYYNHAAANYDIWDNNKRLTNNYVVTYQIYVLWIIQ